MTIRRRLSISYIALVFIPLAFFILVSYFIVKHYTGAINDAEKAVQTMEFNTTLYREMGKDPDFILKKENLEKLIGLSKEPSKLTAYVIIDNEVFLSAGVEREAPKLGDDNRYINYWKFYTSENKKAIFFVTHSDLIGEDYNITLFAFILFYLISIGLLTYVIGKSITSPLAKLRNAAIDIKNEEFDKPIIYNKKDEMREVFKAFDEMRIKLRETIRKQVKYEDNRRELIANISHDLKTPITAIKGYIEGIVDGVANTPEKIARYHKTIYKKVNLLNNMIENLFLFSKLDLKTEVFNFQNLDINQYLVDIIEEAKFDSPDTKISYIPNEDPVYGKIDPIQIQRVINNLIGNSIKYSDKSKTQVSVELNVGDMMRVSIKDNGPGIKPEAIGNIFKRFYRSDPARSSSTEGSGLGLSIAREIIHAHNGYITAYNNLEEGVTVSFSLPLEVI